MPSTDPDVDVAQIVLDLLKSEWNTPDDPENPQPDEVEQPDIFRLRTEDETGTPKKNVDPQASEYFLFSEVDERNEEYADPGRHTMNFDYACFAEFATIHGRDRRREVYEEARRILRENNSRYRAEQVLGNDLGDWDTLNYNATVPDEDLFDFWVIEWTFSFSATSRTVA